MKNLQTKPNLETVQVMVKEAHRNLDDEELEELITSIANATNQERQEWIETMAESYDAINANDSDVQMFLDYFAIKFDL